MPADLNQPLGFLIVEVARLLRRDFDAALDAAGLELTAGEARALLRCAHHGTGQGIRQSQLAEVMNLEPMTLVGYLDRLEKAGLIGRFPDPSDRRAKLIRPLPAASAVIDRIEAVAGAVRAGATDGMSAEALGAMRQVLEHMHRRLAGGDARPRGGAAAL